MSENVQVLIARAKLQNQHDRERLSYILAVIDCKKSRIAQKAAENVKTTDKMLDNYLAKSLLERQFQS